MKSIKRFFNKQTLIKNIIFIKKKQSIKNSLTNSYLTYNEIGTTVLRTITYEKKTMRAMTVEPVAIFPSLPPSNKVPGTKSSHGK